MCAFKCDSTIGYFKKKKNSFSKFFTICKLFIKFSLIFLFHVLHFGISFSNPTVYIINEISAVCRIDPMLQNGPDCISYMYIFLHHFAVGPTDLNSKHCALSALHTQWEKFHIAIWYLDIRYKEASVRVISNDDRTIICTFQSNGLTVAGIYKVCIDVIESYAIIIRIWRLKWLDLRKRATITWNYENKNNIAWNYEKKSNGEKGRGRNTNTANRERNSRAASYKGESAGWRRVQQKFFSDRNSMYPQKLTRK